MAVPDQLHLQLINEIAEALSSCERRTLFYLCGSLDTDHSVARMKEMLISKVMDQENAHRFLAELMWHLQRFDILKKVFKVTKGDLEMTHNSRQMVPHFRVLMANISEDLDTNNLDSIKFLLSGRLSREKLEKAKNFLDIIVELEKLDSFSPERVDFVEQCLSNIRRVDLAKKLSAYKMSGRTPERQLNLSLQESCRISQRRQERCIASVNIPLGTCREQSCESSPVCYKFNTNPRGVCVIIDCVGNEGEMLEQTFKALHFSVHLYKCLGANDVLSALKGILGQRDNLRGDGFVCCIISRGTASCLLGTDLTGSGLSMDTVRRLFTADACPLLASKPKLFFIQRYSVPEYRAWPRMSCWDEHLETDGCDGVLSGIPTDADVFWSHCWTDERQLEQMQHRSVYLKALTDALHKAQKRKINITDVQMEVNSAVFEHSQRNPGSSYHLDVKHTLRKDLYLQ